MKPILQKDVVDFLNDYRANSVTEILEGKKQSEIITIAKKRGIDLKDSIDLAGFKNVYAVTRKPNKNNCRLPHEVVKKSLGSLAGKPIDIDHQRAFVVGAYLDGKLEGDKIITYGLFYKNNFGSEWEKAKKLFSEGKLATSFEIHTPKKDREYHKDGTFSLNSIEFAGGAILFNEQPAEEEALVLEIAKKPVKDCIGLECDLVYSSKELITSNTEFSGFSCSCTKCSYTVTLKEGKHCADKKCPDCGAQLRRANRPGPGKGSLEERVERIENKVFKNEKGGNKMAEEKKVEKTTEKEIKVEKKPEVKAKEEKKVEKKEEAKKIDKDTEIADLKTQITALEKALKDKDVDIEKVKADAVKVAKLREEFGESVKELKDEELLNEKTVETLRIKKENEDLKAKVKDVEDKNKELADKVEKASKNTDKTPSGNSDTSDEDTETAKINKGAYK